MVRPLAHDNPGTSGLHGAWWLAQVAFLCLVVLTVFMVVLAALLYAVRGRSRQRR
jgi:hypothetical protein